MADQNNPWDTTPAADSAAQSADAWGTPATAPTDGGGADWLTSTPAPNVEHFNILDPFHKTLIPLDSWVTEGIDWVVTHFRPVFQGVRVPVDYILNGFQQLLLGMPAPVAIIVFALIAWQISGVGMGVATLVSLIAIGAIGASPRQMLFKVQLPLAMPTIMAGVNQTLMLALSMVVIASMIAVGGLGQMVLRGIGRLDMGLATVGGVGIVILAIILDRLTQAVGRDSRSRGNRRWYTTGPVGLLTRPFIK
ncbi:TPA: ABC transporter permease subunit [Escherichia coli]|nr:ABC transporter permease subunit [Escherichia coli]